MKSISRIIIALLLIAMVLPMAVSCANTEQPAETTLPPELIEFIENIFLIKDFALVSVFIIIMYLLTHISWELME